MLPIYQKYMYVKVLLLLSKRKRIEMNEMNAIFLVVSIFTTVQVCKIVYRLLSKQSRENVFSTSKQRFYDVVCLLCYDVL